jgi:hypothetical protein
MKNLGQFNVVYGTSEKLCTVRIEEDETQLVTPSGATIRRFTCIIEDAAHWQVQEMVQGKWGESIFDVLSRTLQILTKRFR